MNLIDRFRGAWLGFQKGSDDIARVFASMAGAGISAWSTNDFATQIDQIVSWVFACSNKIANRVAEVPLRLYQNKKGKLTEITDHIFLDSISEVNPVYNEWELKYLTSAFLSAIGNSYWYITYKKIGNKNVPDQFYPILAHRLKVIPSREIFVAGYQYTTFMGEYIKFLPEEIIHFKTPSLQSYHYGASPVEAAQWPIRINEYMHKHDVSLMKNNAHPGGLLLMGSEPDEVARERVLTQFRKDYSGVEKAGKIALLWGDIKDYKQTGLSPKELESTEMSKAIMYEICAIFGVPVSKLGLDVTQARANTEANDYSFNRETILPQLKLVEQKINEVLMPLYYADGLECHFDNPIPKYFEDVIRQEDIDARNGVRSINEIRQERGLSAVAWGDRPWLPFGVQQVGSRVTEEEEIEEESLKYKSQEQIRDTVWKEFAKRTEPQTQSFRKELNKYFNEQRKEVLSNLEKVKSIEKVSNEDIPAILFDLKEANKKLKQIGLPFLYKSARSGAEATAGMFGFEINWDIAIPRIESWVGDRALQFSKWANETTLGDLRSVLSQGIEEGEGIPALKRRIEGFFDGVIAERSEMIARTEVITASNEGNLEVYREAGITKKQWYTTPDDRLCDFCLMLDNDIVGIDEDFESEEFGKVEGPALHPNCRCVTLPVTEEA